jgi:hypothetical protein
MQNKVINNKFQANLMLAKFPLIFQQFPHPHGGDMGPLGYTKKSSIKFTFQQKYLASFQVV